MIFVEAIAYVEALRPQPMARVGRDPMVASARAVLVACAPLTVRGTRRTLPSAVAPERFTELIGNRHPVLCNGGSVAAICSNHHQGRVSWAEEVGTRNLPSVVRSAEFGHARHLARVGVGRSADDGATRRLLVTCGVRIRCPRTALTRADRHQCSRLSCLSRFFSITQGGAGLSRTCAFIDGPDTGQAGDAVATTFKTYHAGQMIWTPAHSGCGFYPLCRRRNLKSSIPSLLSARVSVFFGVGPRKVTCERGIKECEPRPRHGLCEIVCPWVLPGSELVNIQQPSSIGIFLLCPTSYQFRRQPRSHM